MPRHSGITATAIITGLIALCAMSLPAPAGAIPPTGISGTVSSAVTHTGAEGAQVCATPIGGGTTSCVETTVGGKYQLELTEGEYTVRFTGYVCSPSCEQVYASQLHQALVTTGKVTEVNAELLKPGGISGRVTSGGAPVAEIEVCVAGPGFECQETNANGEYMIERLPSGSYTVSFRSTVPSMCKTLGCQRANYITQYWNSWPTYEAANHVTVEAGKTTTGINAELQAGGHISGTVTSASIYAPPIAGVRVCANSTAINKEGEPVGEGECAFTNPSGEYTIQTLASGGYEVEFTGEVCVESSGGKVKCSHPYIDQNYQSVVSVSAPGTTSGIDASLLERSPTKPANTAAPTLTGTAAVGRPLSCSPGTWANNPTSLAYRWLRNGVAIAGQTSNTYTIQRADSGNGIACEVTASNAAGVAASTSNTVQISKLTPGLAVLQGVSVRGATVSVTLLCMGTNPCSGAMKIFIRLTAGRGRHKRMRNVTIGLASFSIGLGKRATFRVYLTGQGRKLLAGAGRRGLRAQIGGVGVKAGAVVLRQALRPRR